MIGKVYKKQGGAGSSDIINGIIEQYKASTSTISANSFVEFVNDYTNPTLGTDTTILSTSGSAYYIGAVLVDTNKVFIAHGTASYSGKLRGIVITINGTTITTGSDTQLDSTNYSAKGISSVLIDTNKVFVSYGIGSSPPQAGYAIVCTISGTTITTGTKLSLAQSVNDNSLRSVKLDTNKVYINAGTNSYLYGIICSISGTTITKNSETRILSSSGMYGDATLVDTNKIFISYSLSNALNGIVCTISGTTITIGTSTQLNSSTDSGISTTAIDINKTFVVFGNNTSDQRLSGIVCTISGTTITKGTSTYLNPNNNTSFSTYGKNQIIKTSKDSVFITHRNSSVGSGLYVIACMINGTTITTGTDINISDKTASYSYSQPLLLDDEHTMAIHPDSSEQMYINEMIVTSKKTIKESISKIEGLTKTEATTSTVGDVWVLNN